MTDGAFLPVNQPLDLATTLHSGQAFRWRTADDGSFNCVLGCDLVRLSDVEGGVRIDSSPQPPSALLESISAYLRLDDDLPAIQAMLSHDSHVAEGIAVYPGLRLLRQDPWETLASFILSSVSNIPRITRTIELIADKFGEPVTFDGVMRNTFPSPERIIDAGEQALRNLGCGYRAPYLIGTAKLVSDGGVSVARLRGLPYAEVQRALMALPGVGEKVADCVMLFALDRLEAFPVDRWIERAVTDWYLPTEKLNYAKVRALALERFGPYAGYANHYLFWQRRKIG
jgi:N-glycosylase/DNA lyase